jgi:hypothetical protein
MARTWLSIRVELVEGRADRFWPRPGRIFAAARRHTFADLAEAIDDAFGRWDRAHLHQFDLSGDRVVTPDDEHAPKDSEPSSKVRLQYGRDYEGDDGPGKDPGWKDLPPLHPHWGPTRRR